MNKIISCNILNDGDNDIKKKIWEYMHRLNLKITDFEVEKWRRYQVGANTRNRISP